MMEENQIEEQESKDDVSNYIKNKIEELKSMDRKDLIHTIVTFMMIMLLCGVFFTLGYAYSVKSSVMVANGIILEMIKKNPSITPILPKLVIYDGYEFNTTTGNLTKTGG